MNGPDCVVEAPSSAATGMEGGVGLATAAADVAPWGLWVVLVSPSFAVVDDEGGL